MTVASAFLALTIILAYIASGAILIVLAVDAIESRARRRIALVLSPLWPVAILYIYAKPAFIAAKDWLVESWNRE